MMVTNMWCNVYLMEFRTSKHLLVSTVDDHKGIQMPYDLTFDFTSNYITNTVCVQNICVSELCTF
jgi:hypothetical protein